MEARGKCNLFQNEFTKCAVRSPTGARAFLMEFLQKKNIGAKIVGLVSDGVYDLQIRKSGIAGAILI